MWQLVGIAIVLVTTKSLNIECTKNIPAILHDNNNKSPDKNDNYLSKQLKKRSIFKLNVHDGTNYQDDFNSELPSWPDIQIDKEDRNPIFNPWGGKRDSSAYKSDPKIRRPARVPFNSWGGKRDGKQHYNNNINHADDDDDDDDENKNSQDSMVFKKPFNNWGDKHSTNFIIEDVLRLTPKSWQYPSLYNEKNRMVKRDVPNKKTPNDDDNLPKMPFKPWAGRKRRDINYDNKDNTKQSPITTLNN